MDKINRIEEFLKLMAGALKSGYQVNSEVVYANLIYLGVEDNKYQDISDKFNGWINHFQNTKNISVFVEESWSCFCQFVNFNGMKNDVYNKIKLYIPIDREHIDKSAIKIFEFLSEHNIPHLSKVGKIIRFDDIVIRVDTPEQADKVMKFVNSDKYIKSGLISSNPFAISDNNIAMVWDGELSFNSVTASWISDYVNWECENNNLDNVSYARFYAYVQKKYQSLFVNGEGLDEYTEFLKHEKRIENTDTDYMVDSKMSNYCDVTKLLIMSLDPQTKKDKLYDFVKMVCSDKYKQENIRRIHCLRTFEKENEKAASKQQVAAFKLAFDYMCEKYKYEDSKMQFMEFLNTGRYDYITNYKGARNLLIDNGINKEIASLIVMAWKSEALDSAIMTTYDRYGYDQAYSAVSNAVFAKNYSYFTNDNNCRSELKTRFEGSNLMEAIRQVLLNDGYDISQGDLCQLYIDKIIAKNKKNGINL